MFNECIRLNDPSANLLAPRVTPSGANLMLEVFGGNLEQNAERFAGLLAVSKHPVAGDDARSGSRRRWSIAGLLWAGLVGCLLVQT